MQFPVARLNTLNTRLCTASLGPLFWPANHGKGRITTKIKKLEIKATGMVQMGNHLGDFCGKWGCSPISLKLSISWHGKMMNSSSSQHLENIPLQVLWMGKSAVCIRGDETTAMTWWWNKQRGNCMSAHMPSTLDFKKNT